MSGERRCEQSRDTRETRIRLALNLDGSGQCEIDSGVPFMDHMLTHLALHASFDLELTCQGDTVVDDHHSVEDMGIVLGKALAQSAGDKRGITRYGAQWLPMDEALALVALDFSGRPLLVYDVPLPRDKAGAFDAELLPEFLRALAQNAGLTLHVELLHGENTHHIIEAIFKALGRALRQAVAIDPTNNRIPSSKGVL